MTSFDGNDGAGHQPAIRLVNYMGDTDDLNKVNMVGPYPNAAARNTELARLQALPLGDRDYYGGYEFRPATIDAGQRRKIVAPEQTARAGTVRDFFYAFFGWDEPAEMAEIPGQMAFGEKP